MTNEGKLEILTAVYDMETGEVEWINEKSETAEEYLGRGLEAHKQGNFTQAISDYTKAIEINPNYAEVYYSRALVFFVSKQYDKAWADVHKAQDLGYAINPTFLGDLKKASGMD